MCVRVSVHFVVVVGEEMQVILWRGLIIRTLCFQRPSPLLSPGIPGQGLWVWLSSALNLVLG